MPNLMNKLKNSINLKPINKINKFLKSLLDN